MVTGVGSPSIKSDIVAAGHQLVRFAPKAGPMTVPPMTNATVAPMVVWMTANARDRNRRRWMSSAHIFRILEHESRHHCELRACQAQRVRDRWRDSGQQGIVSLARAQRQDDFRDSEPLSILVSA